MFWGISLLMQNDLIVAVK